ncbi:ChaN family lipoprotein [Derxia gummosa]|uniref:ChaN family lipoprotein n=1 Tax=Derxia gummosa DSM 723 TaxID=1121388 RepID=A0A8B6XBR3_9BURK|nr:ChaN family lipoprotein [Derxia gummosa]
MTLLLTGVAALLTAGCTTTTTISDAPPITTPFGVPVRTRVAPDARKPDPQPTPAVPAPALLPPGNEWATQALAGVIAGQPLLLLGEVHDNAAQHQLRIEALRRAIVAGARPALLMEQFDRERQPDLDRALAAARRDRAIATPAGLDRLADAVIDAGAPGRKGWDWSAYRGFVVLALGYDLPIIAVNLSRADASKIVGGGLESVFSPAERQSLGLDRPPPESLLAAQAEAIVASHCNQIDTATARRMALAQIARDAVMAAFLRAHAQQAEVLIAGNGHVRRDLGVPQWLGATAAISVGLEEDTGLQPGMALALAADRTGGKPATRYDLVIATPAAQRADPCEAFKAR